MTCATSDQRPPASTLSISGLLECLADGVAALRTSSAYVDDPALRHAADAVADCCGEVAARLAEVRCVPGAGEPAFVLLGRDPDAPDVVRAWAALRGLREPGEKVAAARATADRMAAWRLAATTERYGAPDADPAAETATTQG